MISIIRHAESEYNKTGMDTRNCGITEEGKANANKLKGYYDIALLYPLIRCQDTLRYSQITYDKKFIIELLRT